MVELEDRVDNTPFVFFDLETTGLSPYWGHEICEFGAVRTVGNKSDKSYSVLIHPGRPIPPEIFSINGITDEMVKDSPRFDEVYSSIMEYFGDAVLVAHNAHFDVKFLACTFQKYGYAPLNNLILDSVRISRKMHPELPSHSLMSLKAEFGIHVDRNHRALDDSLALATIFNRYLTEMEAKDINTIRDLLEFHGTAIPFPEVRADISLVNPEFLELVEEALKRETGLAMGYSSPASSGTTRWQLKPLQVYEKGQYIYFTARCIMKEDELTFRLDRVIDMRPMESEM